MSADFSDPTLSPVKRAVLEIRELKSRLSALEARKHEPIAIVGVGLRTAGGVVDTGSFERLLWSGTDAITEIPASRWTLDAWFDESQDAAGKMYTRYGGFIDDIDQFDAEFFGIAPIEAVSMDPQQRLVLELAWEALENAGCAPDSLTGTQTGVYLGISNSDYGRALLTDVDGITPYSSAGTAFSVAAGRVSYVLGLHGPAISVDTACSSSLVALHLACQGLRSGECDMALAGGVNLILTPELNINFSKAGMMSRDGRCHTFDASASGYVRGEGGGMVVLRRLSDAVANGDRVMAIIRGSAMNQDGKSNGLTAPNGTAQRAVVRAALAEAKVAAVDVQYVETHGTGTSLGDPIEVNSLIAELGVGRAADNPLYLGALKTNIGHTEAAAGILGVIKTVVALQREEIPPNLHFKTPNPLIDWDAAPLVVPTTVSRWPSANGQRTAGVSSFGFSGTNAHVLVASAPDARDTEPAVAVADTAYHVLALSARNDTALRVLVTDFRAALNALAIEDHAALRDLCFTANTGRSHFAHRICVTGASASDIAAALAAWLEGEAHPNIVAGVAGAAPPRTAFLFPGQGPQYAGMGRELYESEPAFRHAFDASCAEFDATLGISLKAVVFAGEDMAGVLNRTEYAQPAMFAVEYALAALWTSWGIEPTAVLGHSFGEYAAACAAGVLSLHDAATMVVARGRLVGALPANGQMIVVEAAADELRAAIQGAEDRVALAASNGPANNVISGERDTVTAIARKFVSMGRRVKSLQVSHAFHSPLIDPVLDAFESVAAAVNFSPPTVTFVSTVTGDVANGRVLHQPQYWRTHLRETVQFANAMRTLSTLHITHYIELSPHPVLLGMGAECVPAGDWLPSLRQGESARAGMLHALQLLYVSGAAVKWTAVSPAGRRVPLPLYPFQRRRYWADSLGVMSRRHANVDDFWQHVVPAADAQAACGPIDLNAGSYGETWEVLRRFTVTHVLHTLQTLGVFAEAGDAHTLPSLMTRAGIVPAHGALMTRWLRLLEREGILHEQNTTFELVDGFVTADRHECWAQVSTHLAGNRELLAYIAHCAAQLKDIVTGRTGALESLFPNGTFELATNLYERSATMRYINQLAAACAQAACTALSGSRPLRVLEVGGGTGGTTSALLSVLPAERAVYTFTDVSPLFLDRALTRFSSHAQLRTALFDIESDPAPQGLPLAHFDLIVGANVVHASRDLRSVLPRLRSLLAPGGLLMLIESTRHLDYFDITTGLIEGWQAFADDLRVDDPLLPADTWTAALETAGFVEARAWPPRGSIAGDLGQHVIVARAPGDNTGVPHARTHEPLLRPHTDNVPVLVDETSVRAALSALIATERVAMMCDLVRREVTRILRLDPSMQPARHDRLMDLGMDSLMAVQLRNALSLRLELTDPLSPTLIFDYPTIDAIASLLLDRLDLASEPLVASPAITHGEPTVASSAIATMTDDEIEALLLSRESGK